MPEDFLLQLPQFRLPYKVTAPDQLRFVCVLTSAGLIESESWPRLKMTERFHPVKYAWVDGITAEGLQEIARIKLQAARASEAELEATLSHHITGRDEVPSPLQSNATDFLSPTQLPDGGNRHTERVPQTAWRTASPPG
jgi:hypothetical protein